MEELIRRILKRSLFVLLCLSCLPAFPIHHLLRQRKVLYSSYQVVPYYSNEGVRDFTRGWKILSFIHPSMGIFGCLLDRIDLCLEGITARSVLGVMAFLGLMVTQMIRANLYIAIVGMTGPETEELFNKDNNGSHLNSTHSSPSEKIKSFPAIESKRFQWDEATQGLLFGAFYWCYWMTELPGGVMAQRWGGRKVLGIGVTVAGFLNALVPLASKFHVGLLAAVRAVQGLALGVTWPAIHNLAGCWIPSSERSKFMTVYHGAAIGTALTYPICGFIMGDLGWESTFYIIAALNILWSLGCFFLIFDNPDKHPRITTREKKYLRRQLSGHIKTSTRKGKAFTPWLKIFKSPPYWAVLTASLGVMWCSITLSMQIPSYLRKELHFDLKMNGIISGVPELCKFAFGLFFSTLMDCLLQRRVLSLTLIRKISIATCEYIPAALLLMFHFADASKSSTTAVALLALATTFGGASSSGNLANIVDISPQFAGVILGLIKTLAVIPGILSPLVAGFLTAENKTSGWYNVFSTTAVIHIVCCTVYLVFGSAEIQSWNSLNDSNDGGTQLQELQQPLKHSTEGERKNVQH